MNWEKIIERKENITLTFRGETFTCERRFFEDPESGLKFTDDEQDDEVFWKIIDLYRLKHPDAKDLPVKE